jgi:alanine racemase
MPAFSTPRLIVNLSAIVANWQFLRARFSGEETAAVVKADAYGLGAARVAGALSAAGCHTFFVATLQEGIALRETLADVRILVLHGVLAGEEFAFRQHRLIPVLNSPEQVARWKPVAQEARDAVSALHLDTAMARLGLGVQEWEALDAKDFEACRVSLVMSHLACASEATHPANAAQLAQFQAMTARLKNIPRSLCNSGGILLDKSYHFDLARPGCALYGIAPDGVACEGLQPVATWRAPILQVRTLDRGQAVGYGATRAVEAGTRIATVATGYADGYLRALSNKSYGIIAGIQVPLLGRVTMDMLTFDVTEVTDAQLYEEGEVTLMGPEPTVDLLAARADTIGYELLSRIGDRVQREYVE